LPVLVDHLVGSRVRDGGLGAQGGQRRGPDLFLVGHEGGVGSYILDRFASLDEWLGLIGGVAVLLTLLLNPEGVAGAAAKLPGRRLIEGVA
jgi:hypothetical protein